MEIYKINHICVNQMNTQFCLSYNKGLKIFNMKELNQLSCSNSNTNELGDVLMSAMFYELSLVVFSGSQSNHKYHNKKMVFWDNEKKIAICSTQFKSEILTLKVIKKLTFVGTKDEINICSFNEKYNVIEIIAKVILDNPNTPYFEVWLSNNDQKYYMANIVNKSDIEITVIYENCLETSKIKTFSSGFTEAGIQNIIYNEKLNMLFIIDGNGSNIKGFSCSDFTKKYEFYRGKNFSFISSITCIYDKYIAVSSSNKTIHIFEINPSSNEINLSKSKNIKTSKFSYLSGYIYNLILNPYKLNKSILKIRLNEIDKDEDFFDSDFKKKGTILFFNEMNEELTCLGYNGKIYIIKIDFSALNYEIKNKFTWCFIDDLKNSQYTSEDFSFDLMGWNKKKEENVNTDNWKII